MAEYAYVSIFFFSFQPPAPTPKGRKGPAEPPATKLVADPHVEIVRPNRIEKLVPYQPCA